MDNSVDIIKLEIDGTLDLHTFQPQDIKHLIPDYLDLCIKKGIYQVRIIHGKGTGSLRRTVHATLAKNPHVASYRLAGIEGGSWGATLVDLYRNK